MIENNNHMLYLYLDNLSRAQLVGSSTGIFYLMQWWFADSLVWIRGPVLPL